MARIVGVDLPKNKRGVIGLTYIYGIGRSTSSKILAEAGIDENIKVCDWTDEQVGAIRSTIADMGLKVECTKAIPTAPTLTTFFLTVPVFFAITQHYYLVAFFLFATVFLRPLRVRALFFVL